MASLPGTPLTVPNTATQDVPVRHSFVNPVTKNTTFAVYLSILNSGSKNLSFSTDNGKSWTTVLANSSFGNDGLFDKDLLVKSATVGQPTTYEVVANVL